MTSCWRVLVFLVLSAAACAEAPPSPPRPWPPQPPSAARAPLVVSWIRDERAGSELRLVARLELRSPLSAPVELTVGVPAGVRLLAGSPQRTVVAPPDLLPIDLPYTFSVETAVEGEITLAADVAGEGYGVHARDCYPLTPAHLRSSARPGRSPGPELKVRSRDFGPSDRLEAR